MLKIDKSYVAVALLWASSASIAIIVGAALMAWLFIAQAREA